MRNILMGKDNVMIHSLSNVSISYNFLPNFFSRWRIMITRLKSNANCTVCRMNQMNVISNPISSKWTDPSSSSPPSGSSEEPHDCIGLEISCGSNEVGGNHSYTHVGIYSFIRRLIFSTCELRVWVEE